MGNRTEHIFPGVERPVPYCQIPQSWAVSGMKNDLLTTPSVLAILGVLIGGGYWLYGQFIEKRSDLRVSLVLGGIFIVASMGSLLYNYFKVRVKMKKTDAVLNNNVPTIHWEDAQDLIEEAKMKKGKQPSRH